MPDAIYYSGLPWNARGACRHQHCPRREALNLRRRLYQLDPNSDGKLTRAEVQAKYPCVKWNKLVKLYATFYWRWRFWNYHCQIYIPQLPSSLPQSWKNLPAPNCNPCHKPNAYSGSAKKVIDYLKCIKKPAKKISAKKPEPSTKKKSRPVRRKKLKKTPKDELMSIKISQSELSRLRDRIRKEGIGAERNGRKHEPDIQPGSDRIKTKEGCSCDAAGWVALALGVLFFIWLLRRKKGDDDKGSADKKLPELGKLFNKPFGTQTSSLPSQPPLLSISKKAVTSEELPPPQNGVKVSTQQQEEEIEPPPPPDAREAAKQMRMSSAKHFSLEDKDLGVKVIFSKAESEHELSVEGLDNPQDAIFLAYYWLQNQLGTREGGLHITSSALMVLANQYSLGQSLIEYTDEQLGLGALHLELGHLVNRVTHQLDNGLPLFNVEFITAHLGGYFITRVDATTRRELGKEWYDWRRAEMKRTLDAFVEGNFAQAVVNMEDAYAACAKEAEGPQDELGVLAGLFGVNLAELFYRVATGETDMARRREFLEGAVDRATYASEILSKHKFRSRPGIEYYDLSSAIRHAGVLAKVSTEALHGCGVTGPCLPAGTVVNGYGPTGATIATVSGALRLVSFTPIRSMWK